MSELLVSFVVSIHLFFYVYLFCFFLGIQMFDNDASQDYVM